MRRFHAVGLGLAAAALVLALAAGSASATVPTWWECAKAPKVGMQHTGNYNDKLCTSPNAEGTGKYELQEGAARDRRLKGKSGPAVLHVKTFLGDETVECKKSKDSAVPQSPNLEIDVEVRFIKCLASGGEKCSQFGSKPGEIRLHAMRGELGYLSESPVVVGVRLELEAEPGGVLASFACGAIEVSVSGALIGVEQKDVNEVGKGAETVFSAGEYLGEVEFEGHSFAPLVNPLGFADELEAIAKGEAPPRVLKASICGAPIEALFHEHCAPEAFAGLDQTVLAKSEALMIKA